jgi:hypothetical protein
MPTCKRVRSSSTTNKPTDVIVLRVSLLKALRRQLAADRRRVERQIGKRS